MQPLITTRRVMTWLSMCPAEESSNERQKKAYVAHTLAVLFLNLIGLIAELAFCLKYISIDFEGATFGFMAAMGEFGLIYFMIVAFSMRYHIDNIFTSLSTIYRNHENEMAFRYLTRANRTSEWMWTIYFKSAALSIFVMSTMSVVSVVYCYFTRGALDTKHLYRPSKFVFPWNQTTPAGYFAEISVTTPLMYGYLVVNGVPLLLFISLCMHHQAFYKLFKHKIAKAKKCDTELLCDLIRFHITARDFCSGSVDVYSPFVLVQLICSTVMMTVSVFYFDLQWHQLDSTVIIIVATASLGTSNLLLYCYFGKLATESYEMMADRVYEMEWYEQPNELQKRFILMIQNMQKPVYYHGFYVANLDLRTFIKLCNSIYSYYMVIKTLAAK